MNRPIHPLALAYLEAASVAADAPWVSPEVKACGLALTAWKAAGRPVYADPEPAPGFVRVRVAVSVSPDGTWCAAGGSTGTARALDDCEHEVGDRASWIVADVPLPEPPTEITATVEPA